VKKIIKICLVVIVPLVKSNNTYTIRMTSATSLLNQIFYPYKKFDAAKIHEFGPWMLSKEYLELLEKQTETQVVERLEESDDEPRQQPQPDPLSDKLVQTTLPLDQSTVVEESIVLETVEQTQPQANTWFRSSKPDTLFWSIYTAFHGEAAYHIIGNRYRNTEIEEKQKVMEYIKKNADVFRGSVHNVKITKVSVQEILSDLMLNKKTSWLTFVALCFYYKINAIVSYNKTYYKFLTAHGESWYHFTRNQDGHISVDLEPLSEEGKTKIHDTNILLDYTQAAKPIKAIGSYKVEDLFHMATLLDVVQPPNTKWKKADWYNALVQRCLW